MDAIPTHGMSAALTPDAAIILAGGRGRRLGGVDKPVLRVGPRTLLEVALAAVDGAPTVVVVGPRRDVPSGVTVVREDPPGGGPAAAIAAGLAALPPSDDGLVVVLAADLPAIDADTVRALCAHAVGSGAVLIDGRERRQWLAGVWRHSALVGAVRRRTDWQDRSVRELLGPLDPAEVTGHEAAAADVDTPDDWARWRTAGAEGPGPAAW